MEQGDQEAAGPGSEIGDPQRGPLIGDEAERRLDQGFRVGAGHQGLGREREGQAPELPLPNDPRHRLMGEAAAGEGGQGLGLGRGEGQVGTGDELRRRDAQSRKKQKPGIESRRLEPGPGENLTKLPQGPGAGRGRAAQAPAPCR